MSGDMQTRGQYVNYRYLICVIRLMTRLAEYEKERSHLKIDTINQETDGSHCGNYTFFSVNLDYTPTLTIQSHFREGDSIPRGTSISIKFCAVIFSSCLLCEIITNFPSLILILGLSNEKFNFSLAEF